MDVVSCSELRENPLRKRKGIWHFNNNFKIRGVFKKAFIYQILKQKNSLILAILQYKLSSVKVPFM